jgi:hypothetical protein
MEGMGQEEEEKKSQQKIRMQTAAEWSGVEELGKARGRTDGDGESGSK